MLLLQVLAVVLTSLPLLAGLVLVSLAGRMNEGPGRTALSVAGGVMALLVGLPVLAWGIWLARILPGIH